MFPPKILEEEDVVVAYFMDSQLLTERRLLFVGVIDRTDIGAILLTRVFLTFGFYHQKIKRNDPKNVEK